MSALFPHELPFCLSILLFVSYAGPLLADVRGKEKLALFTLCFNLILPCCAVVYFAASVTAQHLRERMYRHSLFRSRGVCSAHGYKTSCWLCLILQDFISLVKGAEEAQGGSDYANIVLAKLHGCDTLVSLSGGCRVYIEGVSVLVFLVVSGIGDYRKKDHLFVDFGCASQNLILPFLT